jgi:hypothetical protein
VLLGLGLLSVVLGYIGFVKLSSAVGERRSPMDLLYMALQLFVLKSGSEPGPKSWELEIARLLAPALTFYAAGRGLAALMHQQLQSARLSRLKGHTVICGLGRMGLLLAGRLREMGRSVLVIEADKDNPLINTCTDAGVPVLIGTAKDSVLLRRGAAHRAKHLICACGDDGTNAEIACVAREFVAAEKGGPLTCYVHIADPELCILLGREEMGARKTGACRIEYFNVYANAARSVLAEFPIGDGKAPHVIVVGIGRMGQHLVAHAAREWWHAHRADGKRMRITVVDRCAERKAASLTRRYPRLLDACDLMPVEIEVESPDFEQGAFLFDESGRCTATAAYVCLEDSVISLRAALSLLQHSKACPFRIVVRMSADGGLGSLIQPGRDARSRSFEHVHAFELLERVSRPEALLTGSREAIAVSIHQEYVRIRTETGDTPETNPSLVSWEALPEYFKEQNREQADSIAEKLRAIDCAIVPLTDWTAEDLKFTDDEVEIMARMEHLRWMEQAKSEGWVYAPGDKDPVRKTNPCLLPWEDLPKDIQEIDRNAVREIPPLLAEVGYQVHRLTASEE